MTPSRATVIAGVAENGTGDRLTARVRDAHGSDDGVGTRRRTGGEVDLQSQADIGNVGRGDGGGTAAVLQPVGRER
ncbi:MAG: hypothetical protein ACJLS2_06505 [Microcella pacifica]